MTKQVICYTDEFSGRIGNMYKAKIGIRTNHISY